MAIKAVQLNHPGTQKDFCLGKGYGVMNGCRIFRKWNDDKQHYRKFILNKGRYLTDLNSRSRKGDLLFWGEWEGNSLFQPLNFSGDFSPNGIHEPFHSTRIKGRKNTDPYVFGREFYYATCRQSGQMKSLKNGSLILFGTPDEQGSFLLDTVFVVKMCIDSSIIRNRGPFSYSDVYIEETLNQLSNYLGPGVVTDPDKKLYHSQTWFRNHDYFSFVPCKLKQNETLSGFCRVKVPITLISNEVILSEEPRVGKKYLIEDDLNQCKRIWERLVILTLRQGFFLGIQFDEPVTLTNRQFMPVKNLVL